jgi:hypothetical protein
MLSAHANIWVRSFVTDFSIFNTTFANVPARGFAICVINYTFANILANGYTISFGIINTTHANTSARGSPSTLAS